MRWTPLALLLSVACGAPPTVPVPEGPTATLSLDSVSVGDGARELARATGLPIVVDPRAEVYASCAHVSVVAPTARPVDELVTLVRESIRGSGFSLESRPEGLLLGHDGITRPAGCPRTAPSDGTTIADAVGALRDVAGDAAEEEDDDDHTEVPPDPALTAAVRQVSDTEWEVTRAYRESVEPSSVWRASRALPYVEGDRVAGLRLFGVRPNTLLAEIGFLNGDVLRQINGREIAMPDAALETYTALADADRYEIVLLRRGEERTHVVTIVDSLGGP